MAKRSFAKTIVKKKRGFFIGLAILLVGIIICSTSISIPVPGSNDFTKIRGAKDIRFGIDIRGGIEATFASKNFDGVPTEEEMQSARSIFEIRMDNLNILDREITTDTNKGRILVRFPWKSEEKTFNPEKALLELGEMAQLSFKDPDGEVILTGKDVKNSKAVVDQRNNEPQVSLELKPDGAKKFAEATERLYPLSGTGKGYISIHMDEVELSRPNVNAVITDGNAVISGRFTHKEAVALAEKINAGSLPFSMEAINSSTISPSLGYNSLHVMIKAGVIAFIIICIFMLLCYRLSGFVACFSLMAQVVGILLAISIPQQTLTLQGIAGIILSIGMGVDANIIISARIKEEINEGASLNTALTNGFDKAFASVLDGNVTVAIAAITLMIFGSGSMLSFGYSLLTGVILNGITGVYMTRSMIASLSTYKRFQNPWLYGKRSVKLND